MGGGGGVCEKVNSESERWGCLPHVAYRHANANNVDKRSRRRDSLPPAGGPSLTESHLDAQQPATVRGLHARLPAAAGERTREKNQFVAEMQVSRKEREAEEMAV